MADRLSQLQDAVSQLAEHLCNAVGIVQQYAQPGHFEGFEHHVAAVPPVVNEDHAKNFVQLIVRTASDINTLIESLPSDELTPEIQAASMQLLEVKNQEAARQLADVVQEGERLLADIQAALHDIASAQLEMRSWENRSSSASSALHHSSSS